MKYITLGWIHASHFLHRLIHEEKGASAIEYVLIAAVVVAAVNLLGLDDVIQAVGDKLNAAISSAG
ncbi:Flp family type IVb pilin [Photobacterium galatheae]|uniref:Uncharacterized protein n=1 Tax=Photobacterium galatheae TaxID=1654360 RepID=A0A066RRU5_9GAMM|nr:hypothetical protein [Photobacterium galatheae]KDM90113.1 hypothetical protein EA58_19460 [Photobacterium galatheae]MCM0151623.1 hypothetical protein [Photobacterium galatheae]